MAEMTLQTMRRGGIYDHVGHGFHRYSTDEKWFVPHFEKMLYDQALLSKTYLQAYQITENKKYTKVAKEIFDYVLRNMTDPKGGFYSAEDADSEGVEGTFYLWQPKQIASILDKDHAKIFNAQYGVTEKGNFEDNKSIIHIAATPEQLQKDFKKTKEQIENILASFPSSQGFYGKLYRKSPTGKFEFYYNLENLEQITDPELEIANLIRERNWPSGDYVLRIMKHGTPGIKKTISWSISNAEPRGDNYSNNNDNNKTGLDQIKDAISVVRELTPPSAAPNPIEDPSSMAEILSNTLKTGINTAKDFTQEKESTSNIMKDMLSSLKDLGVFEKKDSGLNLGVILQSLGPLLIKVVDTFTKK